jgi:hypothetical protein
MEEWTDPFGSDALAGHLKVVHVSASNHECLTPSIITHLELVSAARTIHEQNRVHTIYQATPKGRFLAVCQVLEPPSWY